ncbi:hypothetical protein PV08_10674 [Exophiala spinifera]|uniref:Isopenicillin N synthase-like Fe(2+) 2OG dioxygenase domain-containing protein n=1 Tax=Exophiala spinifera TaxID=91928 RepID=A0A0D2BJ47_9EURO|nr:uncharacterized protein PV08_10674 [Exophiala spinifera]KIW11374.1 hypothetical protein PV08_10674 [Exophiala spinifera]
MHIKHATPVTVSLSDLQSNTIPFSTLTSAFGPDSLGILVVKDLPSSFSQLRSRVLSHSSRLAHLPGSTLSTLTKPSAKYLVGWSHGVETLRPGVVDTAKGSYYVNCAFYRDPALQGADGTKFPGFEEYTAPNVWPDDRDVPGFKKDAEALITLIIDTAVLVARACDRFAQDEIPGYTPGYLERVVQGSTTTKARLLHYFPMQDPESESGRDGGSRDSKTAATEVDENGDRDRDMEKEGEDEVDDSWCTTHLDHGCLTGLTSAMFIDESTATATAVPTSSSDSTSTSSATTATSSSDSGPVGVQPSSSPSPERLPLDELPSSPDAKSGLYILSRTGETYKVSIPRDCLAFQTGEALELITQGKFKAVPHFVKGVDPKNCGPESRIARNTLAVFTQPNLDEPVDLKTGLTFGEFARGVVKKNTLPATA